MLSGLPGAGKSLLAQGLGQRIGAVVVSVDPIEDAIIRSGVPQSFETGLAAYTVGAVVAATQLRNGLVVIADAANYLEVGREIWRVTADEAGVAIKTIDVTCSDPDEHRRRLESRSRGLDAYPETTWVDVMRRTTETEPWGEVPRLKLDSIRPVEENLDLVCEYLRY